jgi:uncharacterized protein (TIGR02145 family)
MKKFLRFSVLFLLAGFIAAGCSKDDDDNGGTTTSTTTDPGVVINGVKWATRNVDAPGMFAATPESYGMFYQWNRLLGWSSSNPLVNSNGGTSWDNSDPSGTEWEAANDPSPAGWRVPTYAEVRTLLDTDKVTNEWTTLNGVIGRKFTDKATGASIFLPAAGYRYNSNGALYYAGTNGDCWSSTQDGSYYAYYLGFDSSSAAAVNGRSYDGFSVRCVQN